MKLILTAFFMAMITFGWSQSASFDYEVNYNYSGIDPLDGDSLFSINCVVDVNESVDFIELKVGTTELGDDILNAQFNISTYVDVSLNEAKSKATIELGDFPQFDKYFNVKLHYLDGTTSEAISKSVLFINPQN